VDKSNIDMPNIAGLVILIAAAVLSTWSGWCAWRSKGRLLKWGGTGAATVSTAALSLASVLAITGLIKLHTRNAPLPDLSVAGTAGQIQRGQDIADSFCSACHSRTGPLTGDVDIGGDFPITIGSFVSSNLTPAGRLSRWSDGEIFRAIRNAVDADGRWLTIMSYINAGRLSDGDIQAVIAYLRSQPSAGRETADPPDRFNLLGVIMLGAGILPAGKPIIVGAITAPPKGPTARYGEYILSYQDCRSCHGADLTGGAEGQLAPIGPDLALVKEWTLAEFIATLRTGIDPGGHELGPKMPWRPIGKMGDEELTAIYRYLIRQPESHITAAN
jgi:mono/diheme cytochrome c family protein